MDKNLEKRLVDLMINNPNDFTFDKWTMIHKSGVQIWLANKPYADLNVYRPMETERIKGWWRRRKVRKIIESIRVRKLHYLLDETKK